MHLVQDKAIDMFKEVTQVKIIGPMEKVKLNPGDVWHEAPVIYDSSYIALSDKLSTQLSKASSASTFSFSHISMLKMTIQDQAYDLIYLRKLVLFVLGARSSLSSNLSDTHANLHDVVVDTIGNLVVEDFEDDFVETNFDRFKASMEFSF
ncbi:hypothetical protein GBA52_024046 [Prunus armeniaca]|nr:hypothetical protein GBA52_024046 [Prunus armeniaca]